MDPREHPDSLDLVWNKNKQNKQTNKKTGFQDGLECLHFARLGRLVREPAGAGSDEEISSRYCLRWLLAKWTYLVSS